jgi:hypothetical protein
MYPKAFWKSASLFCNNIGKKGFYFTLTALLFIAGEWQLPLVVSQSQKTAPTWLVSALVVGLLTVHAST